MLFRSSLGFLGHFPNFALPWAFIEFFGLPRPNYVIPHPCGSWACHQRLTFFYFHYFGSAATQSHFSTSYTAHGLLFLSFQATLSPFTSSRLICLSHGPVIHYSCRLGLMSFLSVCQLLSIRVVGLLPSSWTSEMAINNHHL